MNKIEIKKKFEELINKFKKYEKLGALDNYSEENIRSWCNELLNIFGWDLHNTNDVIQEKFLTKEQLELLKLIDSHHKKPDYKLMKAYKQVGTLVDTKNIDVNIKNDIKGAFQIKAYGWTCSVPCAFITNFKEMSIYDCRYMPNVNDDIEKGRTYFTIDEYLDNFDYIYDRLYKDNIVNGDVEKLYQIKKMEGIQNVDEKFTDDLTVFRLNLANEVFIRNPELIDNNSSILSHIVQILLDRIVFIRVCESRGIEKLGLLKCFSEQGFWDKFKESSYLNFNKHYDGYLFDDQEDNEIINKLIIDNKVFDEFIEKLYEPYPYKFDVMEISIIAQIYEKFLENELIIKEDKVIQQYKKEYMKTQGAVSTPKYLVDLMVRNTLDLEKINCVEELLKVKILEPCHGSGTFLIVIFEVLEEKLKRLYLENRVEDKYKDWFVVKDGRVYLKVQAKQSLMVNCIYGIDLDAEAVEVATMSLCLKVIDFDNKLILQECGVWGEKILNNVGKNLIIGNTLVETDILEKIKLNIVEAKQIKPILIKEKVFKDIFEIYGGFHYIITNPPYVETKHYKASQPKMHKYISKKYKSFDGKADLSVIFIERCLDLLNNEGKFSVLVQKRFLKTEYGKGIRDIIYDGGLLEMVIDFESTNLFKNRTVYVAGLFFDKSNTKKIDVSKISIQESSIVKEEQDTIYQVNNDKFRYINLDGEEASLIRKIKEIDYDIDVIIEKDILSERSWAFKYIDIIRIAMEKKGKLGVLSSYPGLQIKDGIQALLKKVYHISDYTIKDNIITGKNGFKEVVSVELDSCKPVIYNKVFYCYKDLTPDAYSIFPYDGESYDEEVEFEEFCNRFPLCGKYLEENKERITKTVKTFEDENIWHCYTRKHNHKCFDDKKIVIPMTAKNTFASLIFDKGVYMDNSNVWFIKVDDNNEDVLRAISLVINSIPFTVFAEIGANVQDNDYYKFNKQFLKDVPFPIIKLTDCDIINQLSELVIKIDEAQREYLHCLREDRSSINSILSGYWNMADELVCELYELSEEQKKIVLNYGRSVDRIDIVK